MHLVSLVTYDAPPGLVESDQGGPAGVSWQGVGPVM
jgi:hypothetical protein